MVTYSGTYDCKMDPKGRVVLPAKLKARLPDAAEQKIVIVLGFQKCLTIYTYAQWEEKIASFANVSEYDAKGQKFIRDFTRGMAEETLDSVGRFTLNKKLIQYAGLTSDVVLAGVGSKIEIWNPETYENSLTSLEERESLQPIAQEIFDAPKSQNSNN